MATCLDAAGASYPSSYRGHPIMPMEGRSLMPILHGAEREERPIFWEHEGNRAVRLGKWKLVARYPQEWELYDMESDRTELNDLAGKHPGQVKDLAALYQDWAKRCGVLPWNQVPPVQPAK
jgi:arylsulfatase